jgi:hypothetical protein
VLAAVLPNIRHIEDLSEARILQFDVDESQEDRLPLYLPRKLLPRHLLWLDVHKASYITAPSLHAVISHCNELVVYRARYNLQVSCYSYSGQSCMYTC